MGLAQGSTLRIVGDRTRIAMPEVGLGLFPDVGATWFLNQLQGEMGLYLGLSGVRLRANDLVALGLATHFVPASAGPALIEDLAAGPLDPSPRAARSSLLPSKRSKNYWETCLAGTIC